MTTDIDDWAKTIGLKSWITADKLTQLSWTSFEKAFDTPSHELLKSKLYGYGIDGKTLKWIEALFSVSDSNDL